MTRPGTTRRPTRLAVSALLAVLALVASGCRDERTQSMLHPAGPAAEAVATLWWVMFWMGTAVFLAVMIVAVLAISRQPGSDRPPGGSGRFVVVSGIVLPAFVLVFLLVYSLQTQIALRVPDTQITVEVVGHMWWWEVRYPNHGIVTANEIRIPAGAPVRLELRSADVIHSFWVPQLHGKMDLIPEVTNTFWIEADRPGVFRGQCAEFCGLQHALMAFVVVAEPEAEFEQWLARQAVPAGAPITDEVALGQVVFEEAGCANCHAVRGIWDDPQEIAPDLSDFGSRLTIGAGTRPNTTGDLAGWIANPQAIKPGNKMPPTYLPPDELHAVVAFLQSLR